MTPGPAFWRAAPLLVVTFVHRMASIALSLLPALLVDREASIAAAAVAMGVVKSAGIVGNLASGVVADRFGLRVTLVCSLGLAGLGVLGMLVPRSVELLCVGAAIAQIGTGMVPGATRLMLAAMVPLEEQRAALAWQRSTANLGLVVSFSLGAALGGHVPVLLALDAAASFGAAAFAARLPGGAPVAATPKAGSASTVIPFVWMTVILGGYNLVYEAYFTATAAQLRAALGPAGVSWYSAVMVLNVVGCAALGVLAARWIDEPRWSIPGGLVLLLVGAGVGVA
ncbi:MAG: MFS transporter, partial [Myxococcota bacterium]